MAKPTTAIKKRLSPKISHKFSRSTEIRRPIVDK
jgi:hypothetical protein